MNNYKELIVWRKSIELCENIYKITNKYPKDELYWLVSQMRRCSISIPSNIAEWHWRLNKKEYKQFLWISKWSCNELETQLIISEKLWFIDKNKLNILLDLNLEIIKILSTIINKIS